MGGVIMLHMPVMCAAGVSVIMTVFKWGGMRMHVTATNSFGAIRERARRVMRHHRLLPGL
jgi:hypothetical protein